MNFIKLSPYNPGPDILVNPVQILHIVPQREGTRPSSKLNFTDGNNIIVNHSLDELQTLITAASGV